MNFKDCKIIYVFMILIVIGVIIWFFTSDKQKRKRKTKKYNCIKLNIEGDDVREWNNFTFTIDGVEYDTIKRFITNNKSHMIDNTNSIGDNLLFKKIWKDGKLIPIMLSKDSKIDVKTEFLYSEYYPQSKITSYKTSLIDYN